MSDTRTADDIVTLVTSAATQADAQAVMDGVRSRALLLATADLLYIDADGRASASLRKAIVREARAGMATQASTRVRR
jgi:uncharacterized protein (DUF1697 family)